MQHNSDSILSDTSCLIILDKIDVLKGRKVAENKKEDTM